jgi:hypothetical protein
MAASLKDEILHELDKLSVEQQREILKLAKSLQHVTRPVGIPGKVLIARAREISFDPEDLAEIAKAIEEDCERIDWDEWQ